MKAQNQFMTSQTNLIYDIEADEIHLINKIEELNDWDIIEVKERDFNITIWRCRKKNKNEYPLGYNPYQE